MDMNDKYWAPQKKLGGGWIAYKDTPSAPAAPDPTATAAAQTASNVNTAIANATLNRVNQTTPWGSQTYTAGTPDASGVSQWSSNTTLAPAQQALLDSSNKISQGLADLGNNQIGNVAKAVAQPLDLSKAPALQNGSLTSNITPGSVQSSIADSGPIQGQVNTSKVPGLVGGAQLSDAMQQAQKAAYQNQTQYLDPQYQQQQHDLENSLTQQGIMQNSDAWNRAVNNQNLQKQTAYTNAYNNSVGLGNAAEAQLYGQGLSSNQNAYSQALNNGTFANAAQGQTYGQNANNASFANAAQNQIFGQGVINAQLNNAAAGQAFSQSDTARNQNINELLMQQQNPLNILNSLRSGAQVQAPTFGVAPQTSVAPTNTAGIAQQNYANQMSGYNAQVGSNNAMTGGLFSLGGAALMSPAGTFSGLAALSDRRAKDNIVRIGERPDGIGIYSFTYKPEFHGEYGDGMYIGVMADEVEKVMPEAVLTHSSGIKMVDYGRLQ